MSKHQNSVDTIAQSKVWSYARWSSDSQTDGDSQRRQLAASEEWCKRRGLTLAGSAEDVGVSAYKGKNLSPESELNQLLKRMSPGDVLLIEDNDRFSRKDPITALSALRKIVVERGIKVTFLKTNVEATAENFNDPGVLFPNFFQSYLGNAESAKKAMRVKASWDARKADMTAAKPINQNLPGWLRWEADPVAKQPGVGKVVQIAERVATVQNIFRWYLSGLSIRQISLKLVTENVPRISKCRKGQWNTAYLSELLRNRAVLGDSNHSSPPTPDIFPRLVSDKDFYAVADRLTAARHFSGATVKAQTNLFQGLVKCPKCGGTMNKITYRREGKEDVSRLICGGAMRAATDCGTHGMRYDIFEQSFLALNESSILKALECERGSSPLDDLKAKLASVQTRCNAWFKKIESDDNPSPRIMAALAQLEAQEAELLAQVQAEEAKAKAMPAPVASARSFIEAIDDPLKIDRVKCRELLRGFVEKIVIDVADQSYAVHFKGGSEPMNVTLIRV